MPARRIDTRETYQTNVITTTHTKSNAESCEVNGSGLLVCFCLKGFAFLPCMDHTSGEEYETINLKNVTRSSQLWLKSIKPLGNTYRYVYVQSFNLPDIISINLKFTFFKTENLLKVFLDNQISFISVPAEFTLFLGMN